MISKCNILFFIGILSIITRVSCYLEYDGWLNIELHHSLSADPNKFIFRGNITISSLNTGIAVIEQEPLGLQEKNTLNLLAENNDFYHLKAIAVYSDGRKNTFLTSAKACSLVNSRLTDVLWVSVDSTGFVTAITDTVSGIGEDIICSESSLYLNDFTTDVLIRHMDLAPMPDTATFIQKIEREREAREKGEVRDNRGFFAKYWMYIVPAVLLVLVSGANNPDSGAAK